MFKRLSVASTLLYLATCFAGSPKFPLVSGTYTFSHRLSEQPTEKSFKVRVVVSGSKVSVFYNKANSAFPVGIIASGQLVWNKRSEQWIIATSKADINSQEIGGCSNGPEVIDPIHRIYWTC